LSSLAGEQVLEAPAPPAPRARLPARARRALDPAGLLQVVADQAIVATEGRDHQVPPLAVEDLSSRLVAHGLHVGVVVRQMAAIVLAAWMAEEGEALGAGRGQREAAVSGSGHGRYAQPDVLHGVEPQLGG